MIKSKLGFFQIVIKFLLWDAIKLSQATFSEAPKGFNTINMALPSSELVITMFDAIMFVITDVYQAIITTPTVTVNTTIEAYFPSYNTLKCLFLGVWNNFSIYVSLAFKNTKHNGFISSSTPAFTGNSAGSEVGFINFDGSFKRVILFTPISNFPTQFINYIGNRTQGNTAKFSRFGRCRIHGKTLNDVPKFGLRNFCSFRIIVNSCSAIDY